VSSVGSNQIPNGLDLVIDYVNTLDVEAGADAVADRESLGGWLREHGLLSPAEPISPSDHTDAFRLRAALRALMRANNGHAEAEGAAWAEVEEVARRGELAVHFDPAGAVRVAPDAKGVPAAMSRLLVPVAAAVGDGTWQRVKACRAPDCEWAFYDRSRNRSGVWCEMAVCGNRTKVRAYRSRGSRG